jgi:hypothetical protein
MGKLDSKINLSEGFIVDLLWWTTHLSTSVNGKSLATAEPSHYLFRRVPARVGAVCKNITLNGPRSSQDSKRHIKELP